MIEVLDGSEINFLAVYFSETCTKDDLEGVLRPKIEDILSTWGSLHLLVWIDDDFEGAESNVFQGEFFGRYIDRVRRVAVGGPAEKLFPLKLIRARLKPESYRTFAEEEWDEAWEWIQA